MGKAIRQIQELAPDRGYAIVFNQRLRREDLEQLKEICQAGNIKALILTDARVVPIDQLFAVIGKTDEATLEAALAEKSDAVPPEANLSEVHIASQWAANVKDTPYSMTESASKVMLAEKEVPLDVTEAASV